MADDWRWTVITGASSGIGAELATRFAERGKALVLVARRRSRLEEIAARIRAERGVPVEVIEADLQDPKAPEALVAAIDERRLAVHTLVNNAGFGLRGAFAELPYDEQVGMIELNVMALTKLCRLVLPGLIARKRGGILNLASTAAYQAGPNMAVYYATKAFVLSFSEALHEEAKPHGVTVTVLCPGPTATEFADRARLGGAWLFKLGVMSAADVARIGVDGYEAGRAVVVPGVVNRLGTIGSQLAPRMLTRRVAQRLQA